MERRQNQRERERERERERLVAITNLDSILFHQSLHDADMPTRTRHMECSTTVVVSSIDVNTFPRVSS